MDIVKSCREQKYHCKFCDKQFGWKETEEKFIQWGEHALDCKGKDLDDPNEWVVID